MLTETDMRASLAVKVKQPLLGRDGSCANLSRAFHVPFAQIFAATSAHTKLFTHVTVKAPTWYLHEKSLLVF